MRGKKLLTTLAVSALLFAGCGLKSGEAIIKTHRSPSSRHIQHE